LKKVIVIDDNSLIRQSICYAIDWDSLGCIVVAEASDGVEGMEKIVEVNPDIIITDIKMPGMDGLDMVQQIRELHPNSKVIVITAYEEFEYAQKAIKTRVFDFIVKPIDDDLLTQSILKAVDELEAECALSNQLTKTETEKEQLSDLMIGALPLLKQNLMMQLIGFQQLDDYKIKENAAYLGIQNEAYALLFIRSEKKKEELIEWADHLKKLATQELDAIDCFAEQLYTILLYMTHSQSQHEYPETITRINNFLRMDMHPDGGVNASPLFFDLSEVQLVFQSMYSAWSADVQTIQEDRVTSYSFLTQNVLKHIADHIKENLSLSQVASVFDINSSYLSSLIKKETGETFTDLVNREKIRIAKRLLMDPSNRIGEIGNQLGFSDYTYFYQVFKKYVGYSPKKYQKRYFQEDIKGRGEFG